MLRSRRPEDGVEVPIERKTRREIGRGIGPLRHPKPQTRTQKPRAPIAKLNEKIRGRGYSPHRKSSDTIKEDRVLGPISQPKEDIYLRRNPKKKESETKQKSTGAVTKHRRRGLHPRKEYHGAPPTKKYCGNYKQSKRSPTTKGATENGNSGQNVTRGKDLEAEFKG